ncbi:alpha/beta hydrolase [Cellulomonas sp. P22]|uniref:alpha/beta hydrolase n=1 Tax=Cellulomonas sp. P22 TaxID=3373189 RepID=UPI0037BEECB0
MAMTASTASAPRPVRVRSSAWWTVPCAVVAAVPVVFAATVWFAQHSLLYHPDRDPVPPADEVLPGARDVELTTADGLTLGAWYLPPSGACTAVVLVAHGNAGNRARRAGLARAIQARGFGVLLMDYRGYGGNAGRPTEAGLALDVRAARTYLLEEAGVAERDLVYLGESLGTGVVTELAVEHPPAALVLRSPLSTLGEAGNALYRMPVSLLLRERYLVREHVGRLRVPTAVVYGTTDVIVRAEHSRQVAEAARAAGAHVVEVEVTATGHADERLVHGDELMDALVAVAVRGGVTGCW